MIEYLHAYLILNLGSYIFQMMAAPPKNPDALEELAYFGLFLVGGFYFINSGAAEYNKMMQSNTGSSVEENLDKMRDALKERKEDDS